jgi:AraC family transcriptional regulator of adaptative response / DNA-3-methyladenine glycosylase II
VQLRLSARVPFHVEGVLAHLVATAVPGLEEWRGGAYHRSVVLDHGPAVIGLRPVADGVGATLRLTDPRDLISAVARCRWLLDLDADPVAIDEALAEDPLLRPALASRPGSRVPRCVDGDELALRIVLGQQVSTAAARTLTRRLVVAVGTALPTALVEPGSTLTHAFPSAAAVADVDPASLAMPARRAATLIGLARALADGAVDLSLGSDRSAAIDVLARLPGIGPWTCGSIAMRALGDPDVLLATDLGVREAASRLGVAPGRPLADRSARWRPWRSYATQVLWGLLDHPINRLPEAAGPTVPPAPRPPVRRR